MPSHWFLFSPFSCPSVELCFICAIDWTWLFLSLQFMLRNSSWQSDFSKPDCAVIRTCCLLQTAGDHLFLCLHIRTTSIRFWFKIRVHWLLGPPVLCLSKSITSSNQSNNEWYVIIVTCFSLLTQVVIKVTVSNCNMCCCSSMYSSSYLELVLDVTCWTKLYPT